MATILSLLLTAQFVMAEYRLYTLKIVHSESGKERTVQSTLDDMQYARLYPVDNGEVVEYLDSWMCWENTSQQFPCPKPE